MDIADVAKTSGVSAATLRFYEKKRLISSIGRHGLRRVFATSVLERLALISLGRSAGFSLDEIGQMFGPNGRPRIDRRKLARKAEELARTIRHLSAVRQALLHAAVCPARTHVECPTFRRLLRVAATRTKRSGTTVDLTPAPLAMLGHKKSINAVSRSASQMTKVNSKA